MRSLGYFFSVNIIFFVELLRADGFTLATLVHTTQDIIPIQDSVIGHCVYGHQRTVTSSIDHTTTSPRKNACMQYANP